MNIRILLVFALVRLAVGDETGFDKFMKGIWKGFRQRLSFSGMGEGQGGAVAGQDDGALVEEGHHRTLVEEIIVLNYMEIAHGATCVNEGDEVTFFVNVTNVAGYATAKVTSLYDDFFGDLQDLLNQPYSTARPSCYSIINYKFSELGQSLYCQYSGTVTLNKFGVFNHSLTSQATKAVDVDGETVKVFGLHTTTEILPGCTEAPTLSPTPIPSTTPTVSPTQAPTTAPTVTTTASPTAAAMTASPTITPTVSPTAAPTITPTGSPTAAATTGTPTATPSASPTLAATTATPTVASTVSPVPLATMAASTVSPTLETATVAPAVAPTASPTAAATIAASTVSSTVLSTPEPTSPPNPSGTPSLSLSSTTATPTANLTSTTTVIPTASKTARASESASAGPTAVMTASVSEGSATAGPTAVANGSESVTRSASLSPTAIFAETMTATSSGSLTASLPENATAYPSESLTASPSETLTGNASARPTTSLAENVTAASSGSPTARLAENGTAYPSEVPTVTSSESLTGNVSASPTTSLAENVTAASSGSPTARLAENGTAFPSEVPTATSSEILTGNVTARPTESLAENMTANLSQTPTPSGSESGAFNMSASATSIPTTSATVNASLQQTDTLAPNISSPTPSAPSDPTLNSTTEMTALTQPTNAPTNSSSAWSASTNYSSSAWPTSFNSSSVQPLMGSTSLPSNISSNGTDAATASGTLIPDLLNWTTPSEVPTLQASSSMTNGFTDLPTGQPSQMATDEVLQTTRTPTQLPSAPAGSTEAPSDWSTVEPISWSNNSSASQNSSSSSTENPTINDFDSEEAAAENVTSQTQMGCCYYSYDVETEGFFITDFPTEEPTTEPTLESEYYDTALDYAQFGRAGSFVYIFFNDATDQGENAGLSGDSFQCSSLFEYSSAAEDCSWKDTQTVKMTLTSLSVIVPGDSITLLGFQVQRLDDGALAESQAIYILSPDNPVTPNIMVTSAESIGVCDDMTVDLSLSTGGGGRSLTFGWKLISFPQSADLTALIQTATTTGNVSVLVIPNAYLVPNSTYILNVTAKNFLESFAWQKVTFDVASVAIPSVLVGGGQSQTIYRHQALLLTAEAEASSADCSDATSGQIEYDWAVYDSDGIATTLSSVHSNPTVMALDAYTLGAGDQYTFSVTVTDSSGMQNSAQVALTVLRQDIVAQIVGGSRTVSTNTTLILDGSSSYDPDTSDGTISGAVYSWACSLEDSAAKNSSCKETVEEKLASLGSLDSTLTFPRDSLEAGLVYNFNLTVSTAWSTASVSVTISTTSLDVPDFPIVSSFSNKVNPSEKFTVQATYSGTLGPGSLLYAWSAAEESAQLVDEVSLATASLTDLSGSLRGPTTEPSVYLVLQANTMLGGETYVFQIQTSFDEQSIVSYSQVEVVVNSPPYSGSIQVIPTTGYALDTIFHLLAFDWEEDAEDLPLEYQFFFKEYDQETIIQLWQQARSNSEVNTFLPLGYGANGTAYVGVKVYDAFEASASDLATVSILNFGYTDSGLIETYLASTSAAIESYSGSVLLQLTVSTASILLDTNCTLSPSCASLYRSDCGDDTDAHSCGSCLPGYYGSSVFTSEPCFTVASTCSNGQIDGTETDIDCGGDCGPCEISSSCETSADCQTEVCQDNACMAANLTCLNNCNGMGSCIFEDVNGNRLGQCTSEDLYCKASCVCPTGWFGTDCSLSPAQAAAQASLAQSMIESIELATQFIYLDEATAEHVFIATYNTLAALGDVIEDSILDDGLVLVNGLMEDILESSELSLSDEGALALIGSVGIALDLGSNETYYQQLEAEMIGNIQDIFLRDMVEGEEQLQLQAGGIKVAAAKVAVSQGSGATQVFLPLTDAETEAGRESEYVEVGQGIANLGSSASVKLSEISTTESLGSSSLAATGPAMNIEILVDSSVGYGGAPWLLVHLNSYDEIEEVATVYKTFEGYCEEDEVAEKFGNCLGQEVQYSCGGEAATISVNCSGPSTTFACALYSDSLQQLDLDACELLGYEGYRATCNCTFAAQTRRRLESSSGSFEGKVFGTFQNINAEISTTFSFTSKPFTNTSVLEQSQAVFITMAVFFVFIPFLTFISPILARKWQRYQQMKVLLGKVAYNEKASHLYGEDQAVLMLKKMVGKKSQLKHRLVNHHGWLVVTQPTTTLHSQTVNCVKLFAEILTLMFWDATLYGLYYPVNQSCLIHETETLCLEVASCNWKSKTQSCTYEEPNGTFGQAMLVSMYILILTLPMLMMISWIIKYTIMLPTKAEDENTFREDDSERYLSPRASSSKVKQVEGNNNLSELKFIYGQKRWEAVQLKGIADIPPKLQKRLQNRGRTSLVTDPLRVTGGASGKHKKDEERRKSHLQYFLDKNVDEGSSIEDRKHKTKMSQKLSEAYLQHHSSHSNSLRSGNSEDSSRSGSSEDSSSQSYSSSSRSHETSDEGDGDSSEESHDQGLSSDESDNESRPGSQYQDSEQSSLLSRQSAYHSSTMRIPSPFKKLERRRHEENPAETVGHAKRRSLNHLPESWLEMARGITENPKEVSPSIDSFYHNPFGEGSPKHETKEYRIDYSDVSSVKTGRSYSPGSSVIRGDYTFNEDVQNGQENVKAKPADKSPKKKDSANAKSKLPNLTIPGRSSERSIGVSSAVPSSAPRLSQVSSLDMHLSGEHEHLDLEKGIEIKEDQTSLPEVPWRSPSAGKMLSMLDMSQFYKHLDSSASSMIDPKPKQRPVFSKKVMSEAELAKIVEEELALHMKSEAHHSRSWTDCLCKSCRDPQAEEVKRATIEKNVLLSVHLEQCLSLLEIAEQNAFLLGAAQIDYFTFGEYRVLMRISENDDKAEGEQEEHTKPDTKVYPCWIPVIGWVLLVGYCFAITYYTVLFGVRFGAQTVNAWLLSFILGFSHDIILFLPLKIYLIYKIMPQALTGRLEMDRVDKLPTYASSLQVARKRRDLTASKILLDHQVPDPNNKLSIFFSKRHNSCTTLGRNLGITLITIVAVLPYDLQDLVTDTSVSCAYTGMVLAIDAVMKLSVAGAAVIISLIGVLIVLILLRLFMKKRQKSQEWKMKVEGSESSTAVEPQKQGSDDHDGYPPYTGRQAQSSKQKGSNKVKDDLQRPKPPSRRDFARAVSKNSVDSRGLELIQESRNMKIDPPLLQGKELSEKEATEICDFLSDSASVMEKKNSAGSVELSERIKQHRKQHQKENRVASPPKRKNTMPSAKVGTGNYSPSRAHMKNEARVTSPPRKRNSNAPPKMNTYSMSSLGSQRSVSTHSSLTASPPQRRVRNEACVTSPPRKRNTNAPPKMSTRSMSSGSTNSYSTDSHSISSPSSIITRSSRHQGHGRRVSSPPDHQTSYTPPKRFTNRISAKYNTYDAPEV